MNRFYYLIISFLFTLTCVGAQQYSAPANPRVTYTLNSDWKLKVGDISNAKDANFDDASWKSITLPYAFNEDEAFRVHIEQLTDTVVWYRKHFRFAGSDKGKKAFLEFEGVRFAAEVYVNGKFTGLHENGVMAFGFDCIHAYESVTFENCWAFYNGYSTAFKSLADGNGFKAGGWGKTPEDKLPEVIPSHTVQFCVAVRNKANGFYSNHQLGGSYWYNNTAYENGTNYNMLNRLHDNKTDVAGYKHVLKNNLGFGAKNFETQNIDTAQCELANNSFNIPGKVTEADFLSLDQSLLTAPRQADGSLPDTNFLKLKKGSKLIDCGAKLGFKYSGKAPDIGAFESK